MFFCANAPSKCFRIIFGVPFHVKDPAPLHHRAAPEQVLGQLPQDLRALELLQPAFRQCLLTADRAKEIALAHAEVSASDARGLECEKDTDGRVDHYDVEFKANGLEYDYEISFDGTVLKSEKERDD